MRKIIEYLYRKFCKPNILETLKSQLNIADYGVNFKEMEKEERLQYLSSAHRIVNEPTFKDNINKAINAQADLTFNGNGNLHNSTVAIMAIRSLQEIFETQARQFEQSKNKKMSDPYEIG